MVDEIVREFDEYLSSLTHNPLEETLIRMRGRRFAQGSSFEVVEEQRFAQSADEMGKASAQAPLVLAERIWAWNGVAKCQKDDVPLQLETLEMIDTLVRSTDGAAGNPDVARAQSDAWALLIASDDSALAMRGIERITDIVRPFADPRPVESHLAHRQTQCAARLARVRAESGSIADAVKAQAQVEAIAAPFVRSPLQWPAFALRRIEALIIIGRGATNANDGAILVEERLELVDAVAAPFRRKPLAYPDVLLILAVAWEFAARLRAIVFVDARSAAEAAAKVSRIVAPFKQDPLRFRTILESEIRAWIHVIEAHERSSTGTFSSENAAAKVEALCAPFDSDALARPSVARLRARALRFLAVVRQRHGSSPKRVEELALHVDEIARPFGRDYTLGVEQGAA